MSGCYVYYMHYTSIQAYPQERIEYILVCRHILLGIQQDCCIAKITLLLPVQYKNSACKLEFT